MTTLGIIEVLVRVAWLLGAGAFVIGLMRMNSPATARNGNLVSAGGMTLAIGATAVLILSQQLYGDGISATTWIIIGLGVAIGGGAGLYTAKTVKMTAMPQLVSLFNAVGGGAAALIAIDDYLGLTAAPSLQINVATVLDIVIGSITFTGSLIASGKLMGLRITPSRPVMIPGGRIVTAALALIVAVGAIYLWAGNLSLPVMALILVAALIFGVTMTLPIGGADMPVVISLLNSFTGTAVAMAGFVLNNPVLIIAGALVGASGAILTKLMADAMNRSVMNIMLGGFGGGEGTQTAVGGAGGTVREIGADDVAIQLAYAQSVIIVPGYGLAVAQAQHAVRELAELLEERGVDVKYAIHPVAGPDARAHERAPGRGQRPLSPAQGDGRHQPRVRSLRRGAGHRRQRRDEPGGSPTRLAGVGDADPRRRPRQVHRRDQAIDGPRLRRHRQRAVHRPEDRDAVRRREGRPGRPDRGGQGVVAGRAVEPAQEAPVADRGFIASGPMAPDRPVGPAPVGWTSGIP